MESLTCTRSHEYSPGLNLCFQYPSVGALPQQDLLQLMQHFQRDIQSYQQQKIATMATFDTDIDSDRPTRSTTPEELPIIALTGGLQQFLIKEAMNERMKYTQNMKRNNTSPFTTFHDLPDSLQLEILSYLDAKTLCKICVVCRHWHMLTADELLWDHRLKWDVKKWHQIGCATNPHKYMESEEDWTRKDIYMRCSPDVQKALRSQSSSFLKISSIVRSFLPRKPPFIAMYGPGLESQTSGIVRSMLEDVNLNFKFKVKSMFPGKFDGVGSGFTISIAHNQLMFNLTTLYTSTKKQREQNGNDRMKVNRMLQQQDNDQGVYVLRPPVRKLCAEVDGFIFVMDASLQRNKIMESKIEMNTLLEEVRSKPDVPLLVLNCHTSENEKDGTFTNNASCHQIIEDLSLSNLARPWQVYDCDVETLDGCPEGITWLVETTQRK